ncbi:MAG: hypothetical protein BGO43_09800 [Gammaproteobacteria bacterium 39-13]|nr:hypothetical protein [Gammaproteobacteria bacterium]OJV93931.1 MAG: hypothetical protein BGO43_09800 [Gammaproteobacteria bacterium 39-13]
MASIWAQFKDPEFYYRLYNGGVALGVTYQLVTNPAASILEYGPDILLHGYEAIYPNSANEVMICANFARGIQAGMAFATNIAFVPWHTTIPKIANGLDVLNHAGNIRRRLANLSAHNAEKDQPTMVGRVLSYLAPRWTKGTHLRQEVHSQSKETLKSKEISHRAPKKAQMGKN